MNNKLKSAAVSSAIALLLVPTIGGTVKAAADNTGDNSSVNYSDTQINKSSNQSENSLTQDDIDFLQDKGLSTDEINSSEGTHKNVQLIDGKIVSVQRGKWSTAAKILVKNYNKLPGPIKAVLGYGTVNALGKTLDHYSGNLTDGLTFGLEALGYSPGVARYFANAISWALF